MIQKCLYVFIAVLFAVMTACSGTMQGVVRKDARRVSFNYSDSRIGTADLQVALPDGERFAGRVERGTENTAIDSSATNNADRFEAVESFDGNADAVLSGNRGNIMKCRFRLTDIIIGFSSGGFGICQVADGRVIDIFF
jgi:hypothetical protein